MKTFVEIDAASQEDVKLVKEAKLQFVDNSEEDDDISDYSSDDDATYDSPVQRCSCYLMARNGLKKSDIEFVYEESPNSVKCSQCRASQLQDDSILSSSRKFNEKFHQYIL